MEVAYEKMMQNSEQTAVGCINYLGRRLRLVINNKDVLIKHLAYFTTHPEMKSAARVHVISSCKNARCVNVAHLMIEPQGLTDKAAIRERIEKGATYNGECLISRLQPNVKGYGYFKLGKKTQALHRVVYWVHSDFESIDDLSNVIVRHKCRNKMCVRGDHYETGTVDDNAADRNRDGTQRRGETHQFATIGLKKAQAIADSWYPRRHEAYVSLAKRAMCFGVSQSLVSHIDGRTGWHEVIHPNGLPPKKRKYRKQADIPAVTFSAEDQSFMLDRLMNESIPIEELNVHCGTSCWLTTKVRMGHKARERNVHVWAAEVAAGRFAKPREVARHLCGNGACVNPEHLKLGTHRENVRDKYVHGTAGKLDMEAVGRIRSLGISTKLLAAQYGVAESTIRDVKARRSWNIAGS